MCRICIEISNGTIMKIASENETARIVIVDNDYMTVTSMQPSLEIERLECAFDLAKKTEREHRIHRK